MERNWHKTGHEVVQIERGQREERVRKRRGMNGGKEVEEGRKRKNG